ncbi:hypothetical protein EYF80_020169 [Liparis tanakae]|uniref:Uncharacterized protein n=1 Tax=Liparis tanakae TaxID=230148 RepID=A0A4Z2HX02_9TELE|nr:hypothetical protein EYF80_020169 [Liparis tanakae]
MGRLGAAATRPPWYKGPRHRAGPPELLRLARGQQEAHAVTPPGTARKSEALLQGEDSEYT